MKYIILFFFLLLPGKNYAQWTIGTTLGYRLNSSIYADPHIAGLGTNDYHNFIYYSSNTLSGIHIGYHLPKRKINIYTRINTGHFSNILFFKKFTSFAYGINEFEKIKIPYRVWEGTLGISHPFITTKKGGSFGSSFELSGYFTDDKALFEYKMGLQEQLNTDNIPIYLDYAFHRDKYEEHGITINAGLYYTYPLSKRWSLRYDLQYALGLKTGQSFWFLYEIKGEGFLTYPGDAISYMKWDQVRNLLTLEYKL